MKSYLNNRVSNSFVCLAACLCLITISTGCKSLALPASQIVPSETLTDDASVTGKYEVRMEPLFGKAGFFEGDIDGPITIQKVLNRSGATKKYRSMDIVILRKLEKTGGMIRLPVDYSPRSRSVVPEQDYAIHPGDMISIKATSNNPIDKVVDALGPGLGSGLVPGLN